MMKKIINYGYSWMAAIFLAASLLEIPLIQLQNQSVEAATTERVGRRNELQQNKEIGQIVKQVNKDHNNLIVSGDKNYRNLWLTIGLTLGIGSLGGLIYDTVRKRTF